MNARRQRRADNLTQKQKERADQLAEIVKELHGTLDDTVLKNDFRILTRSFHRMKAEVLARLDRERDEDSEVGGSTE